MTWYGGVQGEQLDPCYHEPCDTYSTVTGQPPAETMNVYEANPTPANLAIAQQQANSLNGNATEVVRIVVELGDGDRVSELSQTAVAAASGAGVV